MGLNDLMHSRNRYREDPPNFTELAEKYPEFQKFTRQNASGGVSIDFRDPEAIRALTCAVLDKDFNLKLDIPLDHLIPTVPLRLNYILWIEDLLECLSVHGGCTKPVFGVDIGTGASCIYPLLGTRLNGWHFIATEIDETLVSYAQKNVKQNGLDEKITVKTVTPDCYLQTPLKDVTKQIAFCMCNPPFFSSEDDASLGAARTDKRPLPNTICTGTTTETVTGGGEVEFVKGIISDSLKLKEKIRYPWVGRILKQNTIMARISWYTTMLGKKTSVKAVLAYLKKKKVHSITTTEFCQGKTRRWGVAWTFLKGIVNERKHVHSPPSKRHKHQHKPKPLSFVIPVDCMEGTDVLSGFHQVAKRIEQMLKELKIEVQESQSCDSGSSGDVNHVIYRCTAVEHTWANQRRKRREQQRLERLKDDIPSTSETSELICQTDETRDISPKDDREDGKHSSVKTGSENKPKHDDVEEFSGISKRFPKIEDSSLAGLDSTCRSGTLTSLPTKESTVPKKPRPLCTFSVCIESGTEAETEFQGHVSVVMEFIEGEDKNHVYQLHQYLQNKILKGL